MKDLSNFIKIENIKKQICSNCIFIDEIESVDNIINTLNCDIFINLKFKTSNLKDYFIYKFTTLRPDVNIINCNCSIEKYFENSFDGLIIFNNIGKCRSEEILNDIKKYKAIKIC